MITSPFSLISVLLDTHSTPFCTFSHLKKKKKNKSRKHPNPSLLQVLLCCLVQTPFRGSGGDAVQICVGETAWQAQSKGFFINLIQGNATACWSRMETGSLVPELEKSCFPNSVLSKRFRQKYQKLLEKKTAQISPNQNQTQKTQPGGGVALNGTPQKVTGVEV